MGWVLGWGWCVRREWGWVSAVNEVGVCWNGMRCLLGSGQMSGGKKWDAVTIILMIVCHQSPFASD